MLQPLSATARFMKIGLSSKKLSVIDQSMIAYWTIRPRLLAVPGVANVAIWGERIQMMQIQVEPARLRENGVSVQEVMDVSSDALEAGLMTHSEGAMIGTGGFIDTPNQRLGVQHVLPIIDPHTLGDVALTGKGGKQLQLKDVAQVVEGRRDHRRARAAPDRRKIPVGEHAPGDQGSGRGARCTPARLARLGHRRLHLPSSDICRDVDQESQLVPADGLHPAGDRARLVPL
jgi:hypothetical protein